MERYNEQTKASSRHKYSSQYDRESTTDDEDCSERQQFLQPHGLQLNEFTSHITNHNNNNNNVSSNYSRKKRRFKHKEVNGKILFPYKYRSIPEIRSIRSFRKKFIFFIIIFVVILTQIGIALHYVEQNAISTIPGWDRNTTRDIPYYIAPHLNTTLIEPAQVCKPSDNILLLIVICTSVENFENRKVIRETWANTSQFNYRSFQKIHLHSEGKYLNINYKYWKNFTTKQSFPADKLNYPFEEKSSIDNEFANDDIADDLDPNDYNFSVKTIFLVGRTQNNVTQAKLLNESRTYEDILQESFLDSYNNLTLKTIMMLKWINSKCSEKVKYVMKCDDDTFVNVPNLIHVLLGGTVPIYKATVGEYDDRTMKVLSPINRVTKTKNLLLGRKFCNSKPIVDTNSKWFSPSYMYSKKTYPNYLSGTGYVMSYDVAVRLYNASLNTSLFHLEDVYLTGIVAEAAKIIPTNHQLFSYLTYRSFCEFRGMITKHEITSSDMKKAFEFITNTHEKCPLLDTNRRYRKIRPRYCN